MTLRNALVALAACAMAMPAAAQDSAWRLKSPKQETLTQSNEDAVATFVDFTHCVVQRRYDKARAVVAAGYQTPAQATLASKIIMNRGVDEPCITSAFNTQMRFPRGMMAEALALNLVRKDYPDLAAVVASAPAVPEQEQAAEARIGGTEAFGRCVVRRDPQSAQALILSRYASREENAAISGLRDDLGPCLATGQKLTMNPWFLRGVISVAGYRLGQEIAPRPAAARTQP